MIIYICGSTLSEYEGPENREEKGKSAKLILLEKIFLVKVKLSCLIILSIFSSLFAYTGVQKRRQELHKLTKLLIQNVRDANKKQTYPVGKGS